MRVAVVYFSGNNKEKLVSLAKGIAKGIEINGHQVDLINGDVDVNSKLTIYGYLAIGTSTTSFMGGKIPEKVSSFLTNSGIVAGKRCFAFIAKSGLRTTKTLQKLMQTMEHEGMMLKYSEVLSTPEEAQEIGKRLHIE